MNVKLACLIFVAVLLGSAWGSAVVITQTKVVAGATDGSAQAVPHFGQLNPDFVKYQTSLSASGGLASVSQQAKTGFIPPPVNLAQVEGVSSSSAIVGYASSYDLRTQNKLTSVKDQGTCAACWAFASLASLESFLRPAETMDFSENNMKNTVGYDFAPCAGGNHFMATAYLARWSGPVSEAADPYSASGTSSPSNLPVQKHVQDVNFIPDRASSLDNDRIKSAILTYGAVYTTMFMYDSNPYYNGASYAYYYPQNTVPNHGVAIVGWDDSFSSSKFASGNRPAGNGAFIVKNSYGTGWGEQGYFYVSYYDKNFGKYNAVFTAQSPTNYKHIYQYDPLGFTDTFGQGSSAWGANVFTATAAETLTAVSFYTQSLNAPYEVYVYTDPSAGPINPSGYAARATGTIALPGYHTVSLASGVSLRSGQKFSVVVKFTEPNQPNGTPVPIEKPISGYSSQARASAGQSYYHADDGSWSQGSTWRDMTSYSSNTNICIKAFTTTGQAAQLTLVASSTTPAVNQRVTITATLKSGTTPLASKRVSIFHFFKGVRSEDGAWTTNANGQVALTTSWDSVGKREYWAKFVDDSSHTSYYGGVTINVGAAYRTPTLTISHSPLNPTHGQTYSVYGSLTYSGTPLTNRQLTVWVMWPQDGPWQWHYVAITPKTTANGYYSFSTSSSAHLVWWKVRFNGDSVYYPKNVYNEVHIG